MIESDRTQDFAKRSGVPDGSASHIPSKTTHDIQETARVNEHVQRDPQRTTASTPMTIQNPVFSWKKYPEESLEEFNRRTNWQRQIRSYGYGQRKRIALSNENFPFRSNTDNVATASIKVSTPAVPPFPRPSGQTDRNPSINIRGGNSQGGSGSNMASGRPSAGLSTPSGEFFGNSATSVTAPFLQPGQSMRMRHYRTEQTHGQPTSSGNSFDSSTTATTVSISQADPHMQMGSTGIDQSHDPHRTFKQSAVFNGPIDRAGMDHIAHLCSPRYPRSSQERFGLWRTHT